LDSPSTAANILDAAKDLFSTRGYEATTTREIAEEAGVTVGTIYKHYVSKEALLEMIVSAAADELEPILQAEIDRGRSQLLYRLMYRLVEFNLSRPREARIANEDYRSLSEPALGVSIQHRRHIRSMIEAAFFGPDDLSDPERRAMVIVMAATLIGMATAPKDWWHPGSHYSAAETAHIYGTIAQQCMQLDPTSFPSPFDSI
jgi:AcrR family transcriptional regulator